MSTIEKAAARLASRQKPSVGSGTERRSEPTISSASGVAASAAVNGTGSGGLRGHQAEDGANVANLAPARFCDIDLEAMREKGYLVPDAGRSQLAQEMRRIKRPLLLNLQKALAQQAPDEPPANLIMITSALPGEGKTFTAINLAMSIAAEVDRRVLLVDADVARSDVSRQLGLPAARGLSDLLLENNHLFEDAVLTSNVERLSILPAGSPSDQVDELFASEMMGTVVQDLAEADPARVVIFDGSPLLATTEAAVLAHRMGQTVLVVEAGRTPQDAVSQALGLLEGCANVSLVLNKTSGKDTSGYGYGYGYGADGSAEREVKQSQAS